jgi:hypothetical protein
MSHGLGFNSTMGAFIGGAARQANELYAEDRAQQRQDDILQQAWAADADKAAQKWNDKKSSYSQLSAVRDTIKQRLNGNEAATDAVMARYQMNPKMSQDDLNNAINDAGKNITTPSGYNSPFAANLKEQAQSGLEAAQSSINRLNPKYQGRVQPITPWDSGQQQPQASPPMAPTTAQPQSPAQPSQPAEAPRTDEAALNAPSAGEPIPLDNLNTPSAAQPGQAPSSTTSTNGFTSIPLKKDVMSPYQAGRLQMEAQAQRTREEELNFKKSQHTISPEEDAELKAKSATYLDYYKDPHNGLQFRYNQLQSIGQQRVDVQEMYNLLTGGFNANKPQPMFDELNRLTKPMLGLDLSVGSGPDIPGIDKSRFANSVEGATLMKKAINNAIINRLSQLHFGRITNKEANYVESGMPNSGTDPNTNMKIVLAMKADIEKTQAQTMKEYEIANSDPSHPIASSILAKQAVQQMNQERFNAPLPWVQAHTDEAPKGTMAIQVSPGVFRKAGQAL